MAYFENSLHSFSEVTFLLTSLRCASLPALVGTGGLEPCECVTCKVGHSSPNPPRGRAVLAPAPPLQPQGFVWLLRHSSLVLLGRRDNIRRRLYLSVHQDPVTGGRCHTSQRLPPRQGADTPAPPAAAGTKAVAAHHVSLEVLVGLFSASLL